MKTLLIPVDGSMQSRHAAERAAAIAKDSPRTRIVVLNVQQAFARRYTHGLNNEAARRQLRARGEQETALVRGVLDRHGCAYEFVIAFGRPAAVISRIAAERQCTAILMGSRGLGRLGRFLLGSTSDEVRRLAGVPVTLVA
jgi:nucleotide-binding universal stress UspA family protein